YVDQQKVFYYITTMNENYVQPEMPKGAEKGIVRGLYKFASAGRRKKQVRLLGSGAILREVIAAAELLDKDFSVSSEVWSATSFNELARDGRDCDREAMLKPKAKPPVPWVTQCLSGSSAPVIAATDYVKAHADQIRAWVPGPYRVLGTDGFGRSDTRAALRRHFEVDRHFIAVAALRSLVEAGEVEPSIVADAIARYGIDASRPNPLQA
ncbi:MAG: pyruvate dehydrogenase (acetyl-transferring), homodimeric type, partial [Thioalkalivibrio sp.]|nr:pyruvate dehydrogenase (acetyl-transferring), homodimeric type [Thioalkalivibrio sp.]